MPRPRRRPARRDRRVRGRRRALSLAGVVAVATGLLVAAAPGAHGPSDAPPDALGPIGAVDRTWDLAGRGFARGPVAPQDPGTGSAPPAVSPSPTGPEATAAQGGAPPSAEASPAPEPVPTPGAEPAPGPAPGGPAATAAEVVGLTNAERAAAGVPALTVSACATEQALARATVLVAEGRFEHDPLGPVLTACQAREVGENLSIGYPTAAAAVAGWMASPGHRDNLLHASYTHIGVGCVPGDRGLLCAQVFLR